MRKKTLKLMNAALLSLCFVMSPLVVDQGYKKYVRHNIKDNVVAFKDPITGRTYGTGFHIEYNGKVYLMTNKHICNVKEQLHKNRPELRANDQIVKIIKIDEVHDLCVLEPIKNSGLDLKDEAPEIWDKLLLVGHPRGLKAVVREGRLIDKSAEVCLMFMGCFSSYQISATAYPGNSGSPVTDYRGNVIGVLFAGSPAYPHEPFVVPHFYLKMFLRSLNK